MADEITLDAPETRLERFLAAAAGVEGITLDEPQTRIERYLYKIAQGGGGSGVGVLVVHDVDGTLDKTWQEINDAFPMVRVEYDGGASVSVACITGGDESYTVLAWDGDAKAEYVSDSASGYPATE